MAASTEKTAADTAITAETAQASQEQQQQLPSSNPDAEQVKSSSEAVEMTQLQTQPISSIEAATVIAPSASEPLTETIDPSTSSDPPVATKPAIVDPPSQSSDPPRPTASRSETADLALGPDGAALPAHPSDSSEAVLRITLMLTTGARHPYLITSKYLAARKVEALDPQGRFDPREMSAYKLKELIWTDWRSEWEPKPRDPAAIRLIILGRMLDDKSQLKESPFSLLEPNVVHMTVKPADLLDDEAEGAGKGISKSLRGRSVDDGESAGCCRCIIQ